MKKANQLAALVILMLMTACSSQAAIQLTEADNGCTNSINIGGEIGIVLKGNPTTGYSWEEVSFSTNIIKRIRTAQYLPDNSLTSGGVQRVGGGGKFVFQFKAVSSGQGHIKLIYRRSWETTACDKVYSVVIEIK